MLREIARTPHLLVCCDYDGTLSPIVEDPRLAAPLGEAVNGLRALAQLPSTTVAVVSGRALRDLAALSRLPAEVHLVGSHGSEFDLDFIHALDSAQSRLLAQVTALCTDLAREVPGAHLEVKPASVAVHVRRCDPQEGSDLIDRVAAEVGALPNVHLRYGKAVIEVSVVESNKADAVRLLRHRTGATAVLFIGDDITDESVFADLGGPDIGVKVGEGATAARERVADPMAVARLLAELLDERQRWLLGGHATSIEDYALLGSGRTVALVSPLGSIEWMCAPDPDSPALFAALLADSTAGHFSVGPVHAEPPLAQTYVPGTMSVRTRWAGLSVVDTLIGGPGLPAADGAITRLVRTISGRERARVVFAPRPQFGSVPVTLTRVPDGLVVAGGSDAIVMHAPGVDWHVVDEVGGQTAVAIVDPSAGDVLVDLRFGSSDPDGLADRRADTERAWRDWVGRLDLPGIVPDWEARSALVLRALCHEPTGGIIAAATTSLPEGIGGVRNWDYRYVWVRDAALTARALVDIGARDEAEAYLHWLHRVVEQAASPEQLHPLYSLAGGVLGPEAVLDHLPGYAGSRPVRVGNAAQGQVQLDVFGPVVALVDELAHQRGHVTDEEWQLVSDCMAAVEARWQDADHGIWEIRDRPRHHVHSRMMCWLAAERAVRVALLRGEAATTWAALADTIVADIEEHGFDRELDSYVAAYDRREPDAAVLHGLVEGYPAPPERIAGTVAMIEQHLRRIGGVYRYRYDDGLPGPEGAMHLCGAWLAVAYARVGEVGDARQMLDAMADAAGATDLLPEQVDPISGRGLGNHPQAYSHLGVLLVARELRLAADRT